MTQRRKTFAVVTLLFLTPLVAEFLLGDLPLNLLTALIVLAPAYGGAAVLIREAARQTGRGWPTMLMLGAVFALSYEGLITQSLFNHDYLKMHLHLLDHAYVAQLGIGVWWTLLMMNLHTFWSMGVSIALVEALFPDASKTRWLGRVGTAVVAVLFAVGTVVGFGIGFKQNHFVASKTQLLTVAVLSVLVVALAFLLPVGGTRGPRGRAPDPWTTGVAVLLLGLGILYMPPQWGWLAVLGLAAIDGVFLALLSYYSQEAGWGAAHRLSVAAGGALAYGLHAFTLAPLVGGVRWMRISNAVMLAAAVGLIGLCVRRVSSYSTREEVREPGIQEQSG